MNQVYISLGSNRGKREENLHRAIALLNTKAGKVQKASSVYETEPWKMNDDTPFLNQVLLLETKLGADTLMETILETETAMGRVRTTGSYEPRTIDIDILYFNNEVIDTPTLKVPHPYMQFRRFVLIPLTEIAPGFVNPVWHKTTKQLLNECEDACKVSRLESK